MPNPCNPDGAQPRVLLLGDSNMFGSFGQKVERSLKTLGFETHRRGKPTSGLARPDFFDWMKEAPPLLETFRPDAVVIILGGNDGQLLTPYEGQQHAIQWDDEASWRQEYARRVQQLMVTLAGPDRHVFLLGPTNRRPRLAREKMLRVLGVQQEVARSMDGVTWVDTYSLSSDHNGRYLAYGPDEAGQRVPYRLGDGIHLTSEGSAALRDRLLPLLITEGLEGYCSRQIVYKPLMPPYSTAARGR